MNKNKYYAVVSGRQPGIYKKWFTKDGAKIQIDGFRGAIYKGFSTLGEAKQFIKTNKNKNYNSVKDSDFHETNLLKEITIYTDGCSLGNPGPGGYGGIIIINGKQTEFSGGYKYTTNNRMELMACIVGLNKIKKGTHVKIYSDSKYVVNGICKGWADTWKKNEWIKSNKEKAKNSDLWEELLRLCTKHEIVFNWVKGHNGNSNNEKCDRLANEAAKGENLSIDYGYKNNV